jgi:CubicO group peptidase (beta-lactamase class C family)
LLWILSGLNRCTIRTKCGVCVVKTYRAKDFKPLFEFVEGMVAPAKYQTGVLGIADRRGTLDLHAYGRSSDGRAVQQDDIFLLFSVTKPIVCLAVMQLWEQGKLNLNELVSAYIPNFAQNGKESITIWHLLTHTSGMNGGLIGQLVTERRGIELDVQAEMSQAGVDFACGEYKQYNNIAFTVLGEIVQAISGLPLELYLQKHLLEPLGMLHTSFDQHRLNPHKVIPMHSDLAIDLLSFGDSKFAAAGLFSTAGDLLILSQALLNQGSYQGRKIISPYTLKAMIAPQTSGIPYKTQLIPPHMRGVEVGLGWLLPLKRHSLIIRNIFGHNGAGGCMFWVYPEQGMSFVFMTNYDCTEEPHRVDIENIHNVFSACL